MQIVHDLSTSCQIIVLKNMDALFRFSAYKKNDTTRKNLIWTSSPKS